MEKEVLGLYVSGHPLADFEEMLAGANTVAIVQLPEIPENETVAIGGMLAGAKKHVTKKGHQMLFATLEDLTGAVEVIVFPDIYQKHAALLHPDAVLVIRGRLSYKDEEPKVIAEEVVPLTTATPEAVYIDIPPEFEDQAFLERLKGVLGMCQGDSPVYLRFESCGRTVATDRDCWVRPDPDTLAILEELVGSNRVAVRPM
jgi:DNA polymerase-3 subunit alpha